MESKSFWIREKPKMFRLRDLKNGLYQIHSEKHGKAYEGTPKLLFLTAVQLGIRQRDLVLAVRTLQKNNDDYAEFSDSGSLLYTKKDSSWKPS
jgi:hypothetical protein